MIYLLFLYMYIHSKLFSLETVLYTSLFYLVPTLAEEIAFLGLVTPKYLGAGDLGESFFASISSFHWDPVLSTRDNLKGLYDVYVHSYMTLHHEGW